MTVDQPAAPVPIERVPVQLGIAPRSLEEGWRLAQLMAKSELVPKVFRGKPEDVLVAIQLGVEVGFAPMQALQSIAVINGRPTIWGDGFLALIMASPVYAEHEEYYEVDGKRCDGVTAEDLQKPTTAAVCTFVRRGKATPITRRFTVAQARKAGLLGTGTGGKEGTWQTYPDRMLTMRARSWAGRDGFPDVLRGLTTTEEAQDVPPEPKRLTTDKPKPIGFDDWVLELQEVADSGSAFLAEAWKYAPPEARAYLTAVDGSAWDTLKARAAQADAAKAKPEQA